MVDEDHAYILVKMNSYFYIITSTTIRELLSNYYSRVLRVASLNIYLDFFRYNLGFLFIQLMNATIINIYRSSHNDKPTKDEK